ncbi:retrovirus-related Pol polyprotein from transposon 412 [Trichonephila clavipes]|nr:retrovirus-related Pol polyprotein from transposon 412 [Trichonephila clavipes]
MARSVPHSDQEAPTVAEAVVQHWISRYGVPLQLHSDQEEISSLRTNKTGTRKFPLSASVPHRRSRDYRIFTIPDAFGRDLRLPCDLLFGRPPDTPSSPEEYVQNLQARFEDVHNLARERINLRTEKMKTRYDTKATGHQFKEGDKVDNPLCILTQANSKKFLISKEAKPERLFEFFYKGTGLEALELKYKSMVNTKEEAEAELEKKKSSIPELKAELKKWKKLLDSSERISDYRKELMWATVIEMQKIFQKEEEDYQKLVQEINDREDSLEKCKDVTFTELNIPTPRPYGKETREKPPKLKNLPAWFP